MAIGSDISLFISVPGQVRHLIHQQNSTRGCGSDIRAASATVPSNNQVSDLRPILKLLLHGGIASELLDTSKQLGIKAFMTQRLGISSSHYKAIWHPGPSYTTRSGHQPL